jgi:hypothetical protein
VSVGLYRDAIKTAPPYLDSEPISREYEHSLYLHYGRPPYWVHEENEERVSSLIAV